MTARIGRREAVLAILSLPALTGCGASSRTKAKVFKVVKTIARRLGKYTPAGVVAELAGLALEIKAVVDGTDEAVDTVTLTPAEAESLRNGGALEVVDADGTRRAVELRGK